LLAEWRHQSRHQRILPTQRAGQRELDSRGRRDRRKHAHHYGLCAAGLRLEEIGDAGFPFDQFHARPHASLQWHAHQRHTDRPVRRAIYLDTARRDEVQHALRAGQLQPESEQCDGHQPALHATAGPVDGDVGPQTHSLMMRRSSAIPCLRQSACSLAALALLCLGASAAARAQLAPPALASFSPTQAGTGSTVTLTFTGTNFVARLPNVIFSPSQGITVSRIQVVSATQISAQLQIAANAQAGARQVTLMDADHSLRAATAFTITPATASAPNCPPGAAACGGTPQPTPPALRGFTPVQGTQGSTVTLTLTGINFFAPASLQFTPSSGITVLSTTVTNSNQIQAQVSITPTASLGARGVMLTVGGNTRLAATNTFTVVSGAIAV